MINISNFSDITLESEINNQYHLGHILLKCLKQRKLDAICQIDASTGEKETYKSVMSRVIRLARSMRSFGLKSGDVVTLTGRNHNNLRIPYFACILNGLPLSGVNPSFKSDALKKVLEIAQPKISFCDAEEYEIYTQTVQDLGFTTKVITLKGHDNSMDKFIEQYDDDKRQIGDFEPAIFDVEKNYCWLVSTSGTTGVTKLVAFKQKDIIYVLKVMISSGCMGRFVERSQKATLLLSPIQWISAYMTTMGLIFTGTTIIQTPKTTNVEHLIDIINKYKPSVLPTSVSTTALILKNEKKCDLTCIETVIWGGAKVYKEVDSELRVRVREDARIIQLYGQTETLGPIMMTNKDSPLGSCGRAIPNIELRIMDPNSGKEVNEPCKFGELWYKGPMLTEYYNNPEETAKVITEDGWLRTGDMLYRDQNYNYFFVERLNMLINFRIIPTELEEVILQHPGVLEVCVTGIAHATDGEWPVACVVRRPGCEVTAQEIKELIARNLPENKHLRGGVVFVDELPKTSGKIARMKIKEIVCNAQRQ